MVAFEIDLRPGQGLGIFELGASLWTILECLQHHTQKTIHPQIDIKYDTTSPATSPVVLHIRPHLDLVFSPSSQRLTLISLRRLRAPGTALIVRYKEKVISSTSTTTGDGKGTVFRRGGVNQVFGPTYVGDVMRYPGAWFGFEEDGMGGIGSATGHTMGHGKDDRNQEVKRIVVTQRSPGGEDTTQDMDALDEPLECSEMIGDLKEALVKFDQRSSLPVIILSFHLPPGTNGATAQPVEVRVGETTAQDLIADIGSPLRVHYKEDERMQIHRSSPVGSDQEGGVIDDEGYFYNYFQYGMDFLIDGVTHTVRKVVLHSNVPGSHLFQRYKRCHWEIEHPNTDSAPPMSPTLATSSLLSPTSWSNEAPSTSKSTKKGKKKGPTLDGPLVELDDDIMSKSEVGTVHRHGERAHRSTVGIFDKIDVIQAALSSPSDEAPTVSKPPRSAAIPMRGAGTSSKAAATTAISSRSPSSLHFLNAGANPASPPKMMLDRTSDLNGGDAGSLVGGVTQLMGFDGLVLEVSELGDVLSVVVF